MEEGVGNRNIIYKQNVLLNALKRLTDYAVRHSSPRIRKRASSFGLWMDRAVDRFRSASNPAVTKGMVKGLEGKIKVFNINGRYLPCIIGEHMDNLILQPLGMTYKRYRPYKFWHSPIAQFLLLRELYLAEPKMMVRPICLVLDARRKPIGFLMENARGTSLEKLIRDNRLSYRDSLKIEKTVKAFIRRIHEKGVGHGDLNISNIIIDENTAVKLIDPLELTSKKRAIRDDYAWFRHLKKEFGSYRRRL